jgi:hypothetical protein
LWRDRSRSKQLLIALRAGDQLGSEGRDYGSSVASAKSKVDVGQHNLLIEARANITGG